MIRPGRTTPPVVAFAIGAGGLELSGSLLHALVLRDLPPGIALGWLIRRDLAIALLSAVVFGVGLRLLGSSSLRAAHSGDLMVAGLLGLVFALLLELLGNIFPGALFGPTSVMPAVVAWGFFLIAPLLAARAMVRRLRAPLLSLAAIENELAAASERARRLASAVPVERLTQRPASGGWSAVECLVHLNLTSQSMLPLLTEAVATARAKGLLGGGPFRMDLAGRLLRWSLEPPSRIRVKTTPGFEPTDPRPAKEVLAAFLALQDQLVATLRAAEAIALDKVKVPSPFNRRVRYNLPSAFAIVAAHERRHLWQAERAAGLDPGA